MFCYRYLFLHLCIIWAVIGYFPVISSLFRCVQCPASFIPSATFAQVSPSSQKCHFLFVSISFGTRPSECIIKLSAAAKRGKRPQTFATNKPSTRLFQIWPYTDQDTEEISCLDKSHCLVTVRLSPLITSSLFVCVELFFFLLSPVSTLHLFQNNHEEPVSPSRWCNSAPEQEINQ